MKNIQPVHDELLKLITVTADKFSDWLVY
jgi:hypothetical protein